VFIDREDLSGAIRELQNAIDLRPQDFSLWLILGDLQLQNKDEEGARLAYLNSLQLAPHYSEPHRALGKLFLAQGRLDDAFKEFRSAVAVNPVLLPEIIAIALDIYHNNPAAVRLAIQPQSPSAYVLLANALFDKGAVGEAVTSFRLAGVVDVADRRSFIDKLFAAKRFLEAFEVWIGWPAEDDFPRKYLGVVTNYGFEKSIDFEDVGFDWRIASDLKNIRVKVDRENPFTGISSLRIDFHGNFTASNAAVYQIVLVEPNSKYRLNFAARTEKLKTGALPVITISDASDNRILAQSTTLPADTKGWEKFTIDCTTTERTSAVVISIQRKARDGSAYPIFGRMWVDEFVLEKS
jgi:hypothetical protein